MEIFADLLKEKERIKLQNGEQTAIALVDSVRENKFAVKAEKNFPEDFGDKNKGKIVGTFIKDDSVCTFESKILSKETHPQLLVLSWPDTIVIERIKCYQKSGFTGVEVYVPFKYAFVGKGQREIQFNREGVAVWIGGDHLIMASVVEIPVGSQLALEIGRPVSNYPFHAFVRANGFEKRGKLYYVDLVYHALSEKDRDRILKYCLQKQAQLSKAGLMESK